MIGLLGGAAAGAATMYLLDPDQGENRRQAALDAANRALEATTGAVGSAYESTTHALGDVIDRVSHKAGDLTHAAAASIPSMEAARKTGRGLLRRASNYGSGYVPHVHFAKNDHQGVSPTTAGLTAGGALLLGVGAMFFLDPQRGRGRRAWIMQKLTRCLHETGDFMRATGRHLRNKTVGLAHETRSMIPGGDEELTDEQLGNRVRSELGHLGIRGSIGVRSESGRIILTGRCPSGDVDRILGLVRGVRGVSAIDNQLTTGERYPATGAATSNPSTSNLSA